MTEQKHPRRPRILRGDTPTDPMPIVDLIRRTPYKDAQVPQVAAPDDQLRRALDFAVGVGELMLRSGAGAPQVEGGIAAVAAAAGVDRLELDITFQSIFVQTRSSDGSPYTLLKVVRHSRHDYARLVGVHRLVESFVARDLTLAEARVRLRQIERHPRNFPDWAVQLATAGLAAAVAVIIGAGPEAAVLTIGVTLVVGLVHRAHAKIDLPEFYGNAINAFVATLLAGAAYALGAVGFLQIDGKDFAYIVAGGIVAMLPGRTMASAIEDVIFGYPLTGAGRLLAVFLSLTGLIIGIASGLGAMLTLTTLLNTSFVPPSVLDLRITSAPLVPALIGAFVVGLTASVTVQNRLRLIWPTAVLTVVGVVAVAVFTRVLGVGFVTATGLGAVSIGVLGRILAQRLGAPSIAVIVPASFGLLPGLTIFRGLYEMVAQGGSDPGLLSLQSGLTTLLSAGAALLAIATGTTLGDFLMAPWDRHIRGKERRRPLASQPSDEES